MNRMMVWMTWNVWRSSPQEEWKTWLRRHDLDPGRILIGASIEVSEPDHQITVSEYLTDGRFEGVPLASPRVVQCESAVMPWPQIGGCPWGDPFTVGPMTLGEL